jgi:hypothetical protein
MNPPLSLDPGAQVELLAHLVASHLLAKAITDEWLSPELTVLSTRRWLAANGGVADVLQRMMLSSRSLEVAKQAAARECRLLDRRIARGLVNDQMRLNFGTEDVSDIYQFCLDHLTRIRRLR